MKTAKFFAAIVMFAACAKSTGPKTETFPGRQLGESTASPGSNASKPQPLTPDDPSVMNVSAAISPAQARAAVQAPLPTTPPPVTTQAQPAVPAPSSQTVRAPSAPDPATSSTPVTQPTDIAPATTAPDDPRPGVFSPPPPPPQ